MLEFRTQGKGLLFDATFYGALLYIPECMNNLDMSFSGELSTCIDIASLYVR